jgi:flagellar basal body-associated protein FliL
VATDLDPEKLDEKKSDSSKVFLIISLLNVVAMLGACSFFAYSKLFFKRNAITDERERERLSSLLAKPQAQAVPTFVKWDPLSVNIQTSPVQPKPADGTAQQIEGKLHYVTLALAMEIQDEPRRVVVEELKPFILDQLILLLGKKQFHELSTVQGRYILSSQILDMVNQIILSKSSTSNKEDLVTRVYFTQFVVQ